MEDVARVSVIIPAFNAEETLDATLAALASQVSSDDVEVIVADNGSKDRTAAIAESWMDRLPVRVVDASARPGQAAAMNIAAAQAKGDLMVFTDADDVPYAGWVDAWRNLDAAVVHATGPVVWFSYDDVPPEKPVSIGHRPPTHMRFLAYALGTNFAVRRAELERSSGFDEGVPPAQDVDLSWRIQLAGNELVFVPDAVLAKRTRRGVRQSMSQYYRYGLCDPVLYRRYRERGIPRQPTASLLKTYAGLFARLFVMFQPEQRMRWAQQVGRRGGRLVGSVRARVWYP